jgi:hypothetical protein
VDIGLSWRASSEIIFPYSKKKLTFHSFGGNDVAMVGREELRIPKICINDVEVTVKDFECR